MERVQDRFGVRKVFLCAFDERLHEIRGHELYLLQCSVMGYQQSDEPLHGAGILALGDEYDIAGIRIRYHGDIAVVLLGRRLVDAYASDALEFHAIEVLVDDTTHDTAQVLHEHNISLQVAAMDIWLICSIATSMYLFV